LTACCTGRAQGDVQERIWGVAADCEIAAYGSTRRRRERNAVARALPRIERHGCSQSAHSEARSSNRGLRKRNGVVCGVRQSACGALARTDGNATKTDTGWIRRQLTRGSRSSAYEIHVQNPVRGAGRPSQIQIATLPCGGTWGELDGSGYALARRQRQRQGPRRSCEAASDHTHVLNGYRGSP
jgi:hypothetical protein